MAKSAFLGVVCVAHHGVIALRAVQTIDFMTAHRALLPFELLDACSRRMT